MGRIFDDMNFRIEECDPRTEKALVVLAAAHNVRVARAAYEVCKTIRPDSLVMLMNRARVLARSDRT